MNRSVAIFLIVTLIILALCCLLIVVIISGGVVFDSFTRPFDIDWQARSWDVPTATPIVVRPTIEPTRKAAKNLKEPEILTPVVPESEIDEFEDHSALDSSDILTTLKQITVPVKDLHALVRRLEGKEDLPLFLPPPTTILVVGVHEDFWVTNVDDDRSFQVEAILQYITEHAYIWIEEGIHFDGQNLERFAEEFENKIYPNTRAFFGSEWTLGVDSDPHIYILYVSGLGNNLAGYFSSIDEYPPQVHEYSNGHELIVLNAENLALDNGYSYGVLAHEFQHMVHWYRDRNETAWLNEGFSELAAYLNGFEVGEFDQRYFENPDIQLNDWPSYPNNTSPHYGAAYLFLNYFYDRFGEFATQLLVTHPGNGLFSVDAVLNEIDALDSPNGEPITADDFFLEWVLASYLQDDRLADGRYSYNDSPDAPKPTATETIDVCPTGPLTRDVHQYGVDYIRITCPGDHALHFEGSIQVNLLPVGPHSGDFAFWSNKGSESNMTLTRSFDFSNHNGPLTLSYWTWYDLEEDYDYLYLETSTDGKSWQIITTPSGTPDDPTGNNFGWGYNGLSGGSGGWIQEQVELSQFAGEKVQIRFEYVTDAAVNGEGFLVDDIAIPQIGYFSDFEVDSGGWEADGFVRILNQLPQNYLIGLISVGERTTVEKITPSYNNSLDISLHIGEQVQEVILVVSGSTRFTRQKATYRLELQSAE